MGDCGGCGGRSGVSGIVKLEKFFVVHISSRELVSGSDPRRSMSDSPPLSEIISFSNRLLKVSLLAWLSMTCEVKR